VVALSLVGCASGPITAELTQCGRPAQSLVMSWESGLFGESGTIAAQLPDGERLSGKGRQDRRALLSRLRASR